MALLTAFLASFTASEISEYAVAALSAVSEFEVMFDNSFVKSLAYIINKGVSI